MKKVLTAVFIFAAAAHAAAITLTIDEAVQTAMLNNASVVNAGKLREIYDAQVRQYRSYMYPTLSLSGSYTRNLEMPKFVIGGEQITMGEKNAFTAGADASWLLYSGGGVRAGLNIAKDWKSIGYFNYEQVRNTITRMVTNTCYSIILNSSLIDVQEEHLALAKQHLKETQVRYNEGLASSLEVLSQKVNVANIEPTVIKAKSDYELALLNLKQLLNKDPEEEVSLFWDENALRVPVVIPLEEMYERALNHRPELVVQGLNVNVAKAQIKLERANDLPSIAAFANRYYNGQTDAGWPGGEDYYWSSAVGVRVSWSLFEGMRTQSLVKQKKLAYEQAQNTYNDQLVRVKIEVKRNYLNFTEATKRLEAGRGVVQQSRENVNAFLKRYKAGLASRLEVDEATSALNTAQLQYVQAAYDVFSALADLKYSVGTEVIIK